MMSTATSGSLTHYLRQVLRAWEHDDRTDAELLALFARSGDEQAFATLVRRYSVLVWGVCHRTLGHREEAEDAFQATFLVLARKGGQISRKESVGPWLYGVARRTALDVRKSAARRHRHEKQASTMAPAEYTDDATRPDLLAVLDEEILRLPETCRAPLILCRLEGHTYAQAAQSLGCSTAAVGRRVVRAEELLRERLVRRGVVVAGVSLAAVLTGAVTARGMSVCLVGDTIRAAQAFVSGTLDTGPAVSVARGVLQSMGGAKVAWGVVGAILVGAALALVTRPVPQAEANPSLPAGAASQDQAEGLRQDRHGDPLPEAALARLGTVRLRHATGAHSLAFTRDGKSLFTAGQGEPARLWDVATGRLLHRFGDGGEAHLTAAALSPDGRVLAGRAAAGELSLWEVSTGTLLRQLKVLRRGDAPLAFSPDGKTVAAADGPTLRLWEAATGKELWAVNGGRDLQAAAALVYSADGKALIWGDRGGHLNVWNAATGQELHRWDDEESRPISALAPAPDGRLFVVLGPARGAAGGLARMWDVTRGKEVWRLAEEAKNIATAAFSPDGKVLATGGLRGPVCFWDAATGKELRRCAGSLSALCVAFAPDGKTLASGGGGAFGVSGDQAVHLWDVERGREIRRADDGHQATVCSVAFTADGKDIVSGSWEGSVRVWNAATGAQRRRVAPPGDEHLVRGASSSITSTVSPDGNTIASAAWERVEPNSRLKVRLWDGESARELNGWSRDLGNGAAHTLLFSPDGKTVACALWKAAPADQVQLWETATGKERPAIRGGFPAFSPDGKLLATAPFGERQGPGSVTLWEADTARKLCTTRMPEGRAHRLLFSPDGRTLAAVSNMAGNKQSVIHLWPLLRDDARKSDVRLGPSRVLAAGLRSLLAAEVHPYWFGAWAFSPDGRTLAITGEGGTVRLLETASGQERARFTGHGGDVAALAFAPDGRRLASGSRDTTVLVWDVTGGLEDGRLRPASLSARELEKRWDDLGSDDAVRAGRAVWALAADPEQAVSELGERLRTSAADARARVGQIPQLLRDLDDDAFPVREKAKAELTRLGAAAEPALRAALAKATSPEVRRSLEQLVKSAEAERDAPSGETLRGVRALEVLEQVGTRAACEALKAVTTDAAGAYLAQEARAALDRLERTGRR
jgi:RNA polymerase sigma factor (sigma-70 family)